MRNLLILAALTPAIAGCAAFEGSITSLSNTIAQPNVQAALAKVETVSKAIPCDIAAGSSLAKQIESTVKAHTGVANQIDVVSSAVCIGLQGTVVPNTVETNVPAVTAVQ